MRSAKMSVVLGFEPINVPCISGPRYLDENLLTALPVGIFDPLTALVYMYVRIFPSFCMCELIETINAHQQGPGPQLSDNAACWCV